MRLITACFVAIMSSQTIRADDWPQWMGPNRDGTWKETGVLDSFANKSPKKLWSAQVYGGYTGPAVADGKVFVMDYVKTKGDARNNPSVANELVGQERILCLDANSGKQLWKYEYDCQYKVSYPAGPRCTPTVHEGKVYTLGSMGDFVCVSANDGKLLWKKDFKIDYTAKTQIWGFCGHPLIYQNLVICIVGGDGAVAVAFDKETGREVWKSLSATDAGYAPPTLITVAGKTQLVIWHGKALNALNPLTGHKIWSVPLDPGYSMSIMAPRQEGDMLFAGGIGTKAVALKLTDSSPIEVWRGDRKTGVYPVNSTPIIDNGIIYGVDQPGQLRAVELATGKRLWFTFKPVIGDDKDESFRGASSGTAFLVKNGEHYYIFGENGDLVVAKLSRDKYEELGRANLVAPVGEAFGRKVVWSHPAFANQCIYVRNDKEIACYSLAK